MLLAEYSNAILMEQIYILTCEIQCIYNMYTVCTCTIMYNSMTQKQNIFTWQTNIWECVHMLVYYCEGRLSTISINIMYMYMRMTLCIMYPEK